MKCEQAKREILLEQSGELPDRKRSRLNEHVRSCADCRAFRTSSVYLARVATEHGTDDEKVSEFTMSRIEQAGRTAITRRVPRKHPARTEPFIQVWRPVLVYATTVLILILGWVAIQSRSPEQSTIAQTPSIEAPTASDWVNGIDDEIDELNQLLAMTSADLQEYEGDDEWTTEDLATELLIWEESS